MKIFLGQLILILLFSNAACRKSHTENTTIEKKWIVTTVAGDGSPFFADGPALLSKFHTPQDIAAIGDDLYIADALNHRIRKIANGQVTTIAGFDQEDTTSGIGTNAGFIYPLQIVDDASGNLYTLDIEDFRVRRISPAGEVTVLAGSGVHGFADGRADTARFGECSGIAADKNGNIYVVDYDNRRIRKIAATGVVSTIAGNGNQGFVDGSGTAAEFFSPTGIVVDNQGNLFVADLRQIRKITPTGIVSTFVGSQQSGYEDGGPGIATFSLIADMVMDDQSNMYVTDGYRIRKITPQGQVSTVAGTKKGYQDGDGTLAKFDGLNGICIDHQGNLYVTEAYNNRVREISYK